MHKQPGRQSLIRGGCRWQIAATTQVVLVSIGGHHQTWWNSPFAHAFVPDEWHSALQDHFRQRKQSQTAEVRRLTESSVDQGGGATSKGGAGHSLFKPNLQDKKNGTTSHAAWSEPIIKKINARDKDKRLTSDERLLVASGGAPEGKEAPKECPDSPPRKKKRKRGTVAVPLSEVEMLEAHYHSETHLKTTLEEFGEDSEDDCDMEWVHRINDKVLQCLAVRVRVSACKCM